MSAGILVTQGWKWKHIPLNKYQNHTQIGWVTTFSKLPCSSVYLSCKDCWIRQAEVPVAHYYGTFIVDIRWRYETLSLAAWAKDRRKKFSSLTSSERTMSTTQLMFIFTGFGLQTTKQRRPTTALPTANNWSWTVQLESRPATRSRGTKTVTWLTRISVTCWRWMAPCWLSVTFDLQTAAATSVRLPTDRLEISFDVKRSSSLKEVSI